MPTIDDVIAEFQKSILRGERQASSEMLKAYVQGWKRIKAELGQLQKDYDKTVARGESVGVSWIYQNSRLTDMQVLVGKELGRFTKVADIKITDAQRKVIKESLTFSRDEMILRLGPQYDVEDIFRVKSLPTRAIETMVGINQPDSPLKKLLSKISVEGSQKASDALVEGMIMGYNPRKIAPMIRDALGVQLNRALTISRTETMRAQRLATLENYKANGDMVKGWRWVASLDGTCPACMAMHGTEHPLSENMDTHPNCCCNAESITMTWEEIGEKFGMDFSKVEAAGPSFAEVAEKYKMSPEQVARHENRQLTGEAYFKTLSDTEQSKLLGAAKYEAYKAGKFEFEDLAKKTYSAVWGEGRAVASLKDLTGE